MDCLNKFDANHLAAESKGEEYYTENMATKRKLKNCCKRWSDDKNSRDIFVNHKNQIDESSFFKILKKTWNLLFINEEEKGKLLYGEGDQNMYTLPNFLIIDPLSSGVINPFDTDQVGMSLDEGEDIASDNVQVDNGDHGMADSPLEGGYQDCQAAEKKGDFQTAENNGDFQTAENSAEYPLEANHPHCAAGQTWDDGLEEDEHWVAAIHASPVKEENSPMDDLSPDKESSLKMRTSKKSSINKKYIDIYHKHDDSYSFHDKEIDDFLILSDVATGVSGAEEGGEQNRSDEPIELHSGESSQNRVSSDQGWSMPPIDATPSCPNPDVETPSAASQTEADPPQPGGGNGDT
ncbi:hypothetical protein C922_00033 [Plasmodium inui San Antonio 1]|uniref:Uncharacterized protein n=1 Tax=Plasmodium inui San Antonio 1 TaxID=1237626 RepID=W7ABV7_9APIC|nr:hypothetical protein C922_00033 [Plasmodium inui San Antonio 1]EUD69170.1 hypothetical protein C922_00033 [Plasmodium inui San Antonio 1]